MGHLRLILLVSSCRDDRIGPNGMQMEHAVAFVDGCIQLSKIVSVLRAE